MGVDSRNFAPLQNTPFEYLYALRWDSMYSLLLKIVRGQLTDFITDIQQNTEDYILSVTWYPFNLSYFGVFSNRTLTIGKKTFSDLTYKSVRMKPVIPIARVPRRSREFNNFLDFAPYTKMTLQVPFFEKFDIEPRDLYGHYIEVYMAVDLSKNQATCFLYRDNNYLIDSRTVTIGVDIPLGKTNEAEQKRNNVLQTISAIGGAVGVAVGSATGNPLITGASVGLLTKNITTGLQNNVDRLSGFKGSNGGRDFLTVDKRIILMIEQPQFVKRPSMSLKGKVLNETRTLNTLSGYTECDIVHFEPHDTLMTEEEIDDIITQLERGVYL